MTFWIVILAIALFLFLLGCIPIQLNAHITDQDVKLMLQILFFRKDLLREKVRKKKKPKEKALKVRKAQPTEQHKASEKKKKLSFSTIVKVIKPIPKLVRYLVNGLKIKRLELQVKVASDDAADTAILYGRVCAVLYPALAAFRNMITTQVKTITIEPDFYRKQTSYRVCFVAQIRVYRLIFGGFWYLGRMVKVLCRGMLQGKSIKKTA